MCGLRKNGRKQIAARKNGGDDVMLTTLEPLEVKRRADFLAIAGRYTRLRRAGEQYRGLCPFHSERNPSLYIEPQQRVWKCFGCERGGDLFDFVMLAEHCDFSSALRIVAGFEGSSSGQRREAARFGRSEETEGFSARGARDTHRRKTRAELLARLDATDARNGAIRAADAEAFAEFERLCEPQSGEPFTSHRAGKRP